MALTAAELQVKFGADTTDFDRGVATVEKGMGGVEQSVGSARTGMSAFVGAAVGAMALPAIAAGFVGLKNSVIGFNAELEQTQIAFSTMMGSASGARKQIAETLKFAAKTPFRFGELVQSQRLLMAFGFTAKETLPMITDIGDAVAAMGGGSFEIDRVVRSLGQMQAKTKVSAEEMMQLTEVGIPGWKYLADTLNTDVAGAMDAVTKRTVDAGPAIAGILAGMQSDFGGSMKKQAKTFNGAVSTIQDSLQIASASAFKPFFNVLSDIANSIATFVSSKDFEAWSERTRDRVRGVIESFRDMQGMFLKGFRGSERSFDDMVDRVGLVDAAALRLGQVFADLGPRIATGRDMIASIIGPLFDNLQAAFSETFTIIAREVAKLDWQKVGDMIGRILVQLTTFARDVLSIVVPALASMLKWFAEHPRIAAFAVALVATAVALNKVIAAFGMFQFANFAAMAVTTMFIRRMELAGTATVGTADKLAKTWPHAGGMVINALKRIKSGVAIAFGFIKTQVDRVAGPVISHMFDGAIAQGQRFKAATLATANYFRNTWLAAGGSVTRFFAQVVLDGITKTMQGIDKGISAVGGAVIDTVTNMAHAVRMRIIAMYAAIQLSGGGVIGAFKVIMGQLLAAAVATFTTIGAAASAMWTFITGPVGIAVAIIIAAVLLVKRYWGDVVDFLKNLFKGFVNIVKQVIARVVGVVRFIMPGIKAVVIPLLKFIYNIFRGTFALIAEVVGGALRLVIGIFKWLYDTIDSLTGNNLSKSVNFITENWNAIKDTALEMAKVVVEVVAWMVEKVLGAIGWMVEKVTGLLGHLPGEAGRSFREAGAAYKEFQTSVNSGLDSAIDKIESWKSYNQRAAGAGAAAMNSYANSAQKSLRRTSTYAGMNTEKMRTWLAETRGATNGIKNSLQGLASKSKVTSETILNTFDRQREIMKDYKTDWQVINKSNLPEGLKKQLREMGIDGARVVSAFADMNKREMNRAAEDWRAGGRISGEVAIGIENDFKKSQSAIARATEDAALFRAELESLQRLGSVSISANFKGPSGGPTAAGMFGGGNVDKMLAGVLAAFPGLGVTSRYRAGDPGFHGDITNPAADVAAGGWPGDTSGIFNPQALAVYGWLKNAFGSTLRELIYGPFIYERGREGFYKGNDHWGHVHFAERGGIFQKKSLAWLSERNHPEAVIPLDRHGVNILSKALGQAMGQNPRRRRKGNNVNLDSTVVVKMDGRSVATSRRRREILGID